MISLDELADCMALPVALYPNFPFQEPQLLAYWELLKDLDSKEQLFSAIKESVKGSTFFPTVASIIEHARGTRIPPAFTALDAPRGVPMPQEVKDLREKLRAIAPSHPVSEAFGEFIDSTRVPESPDAPDSDSASVEESSTSTQ